MFYDLNSIMSMGCKYWVKEVNYLYYNNIVPWECNGDVKYWYDYDNIIYIGY